MAYRDSKWVCSECGDFMRRKCMNERCEDGKLNQITFGLTKEESEELKIVREGEEDDEKV